MSLYDYRQSLALDQLDASFDALIMAAARKADTAHYRRLMDAFPAQVIELADRYDAPGGILPTDQDAS